MEEKNGCAKLRSTHITGDQMHLDVQTSSANGLQSKDSTASIDEYVLKVRKPYTITKQREKWTEEEHNKFLEAVKLYGRAWRRIEEYIGTKTAVQIRSHAQKFFTKVVRESAGNNATGVNGIEIPPPRPKRKPLHPYPRKLGNSSGKGIEVPDKSAWSMSSNISVSELEKRSPISVLSAFGSEAIGSAGPNSPNCCQSPSSSNPDGSSDEQENGSWSHGGSAEKQRIQFRGSVIDKLTPADSAVELDSVVDGASAWKDGSLKSTQGKCLKLFGKTVHVTDLQKTSSCCFGGAMQFCKPTPTDGTEHHQKSLCDGLENTDQSLLHNSWNQGPSGMPHMFFCPPLPLCSSSSGEATPALPLPFWLPFYGGLSVPHVNPEQIATQWNSSAHLVDATDRKRTQKESSFTGSDATSSSEVVDSQIVADTTDSEVVWNSRFMPSENSAFIRTSSGITTRGFVPYKRCSAEKEVQHSRTACDDNDGQTVELCL